ncbi:MAG: type II toxin-antitoxin system RelE/ParE family toxin [Rubellimicrobium sp.]|nr:type II toxin-antitoxin system RelE/ParE family toxin [Rubellimicrobium sp.]
MKRLHVLPVVRADLKEIGDYIARDNPVRARSFMRELNARMAEIARRPRSFPLRSDLGPGLRAAQHGPYLIFFVETDATVRIVRVLHGARNLPQLLR